MDIREFEQDVTAWFEANTPPRWKELAVQQSEDEYLEFQRSWLTTLNSKGFGAPGVPRAWGGGGFGVREQAVIFAASARAGAPPIDAFEVSLNHVPGTFLAAGTDEQKDKYIRSAIKGTVWCQGFSEPGAGSDLAALSTRAVPERGGWLVTGSKIWTSHAAHAKHCLLLARTGPSASRHAGLSYFVMDMDSPGLTVRTIKQIHGPREFCQIFLDAVMIPAGNLIGEVGNGWQVAQATLAAERGPMTLPIIERIGIALHDLAEQASAERLASGARQPSSLEDRVAGLLARQIAVRSLALDTVDLIDAGFDTRGLTSPLKIAFSELLQEVTDVAARAGSEQTLLDEGTPNFLGYVSGYPMTDWLGSWAATIAGGANEIQRDIIATRLLELPREPRSPATGSQS